MKSELLSHLAHRFLGFRADVHFHAIPTGRLAACFKKHLKACKSYWHTGPHQKTAWLLQTILTIFRFGELKGEKNETKNETPVGPNETKRGSNPRKGPGSKPQQAKPIIRGILPGGLGC
jgi:hypothetical protein